MHERPRIDSTKLTGNRVTSWRLCFSEEMSIDFELFCGVRPRYVDEPTSTIFEWRIES
jgi:hypothetical protein